MINRNMEEIANLKRKAEVNRQSHAMAAESLYAKEASLRLLTIVLSSVVAVLVFADWRLFLSLIPDLTETVFDVAKGILASFVFALTRLGALGSVGR